MDAVIVVSLACQDSPMAIPAPLSLKLGAALANDC
jgi:hypothetical protein